MKIRWSWAQCASVALPMLGLANGRPEVIPTAALKRSDLCGTRDMTLFERELDRLRMNSLFASSQEDLQANDRRLLSPSCEELCKQCIEIDVYFHLSGYHLNRGNTSGPWIIPHPTDEFLDFREELNNRTDHTVSPEVEPGRFSSVEDIYQLIEDNMEFLNTHYADTPFLFRWVNNDPSQATVAVENKYVFMYAGNIHRSNDFAANYHQGDARTLNVYLFYRICGHHFIWLDSNCQTIGAGTNPSYQLDGTADGVYLSYDTLRGGGLKYYSNGISLLHEVGHWLGLLHVFQSETLPTEGTPGADDMDPCDPINVIKGDFVADTPFLPKPSVLMYRCSKTYYEAEGEEIPDSCPKLPGVDPVFNIMNYVGGEDCMNDGHAQITCGQMERMYKQWLLYRDHNTDCAANEMLLNLTIKLETDTVHAEIAALNSDTPILDLMRDMDLSLFPKHATNDTRVLAFCVPEGEYVMGVTESGRNGFAEGFMELSVNGQRVHRVAGNFGSTECLRFNADGVAAESKNDVESVGAEFGEPFKFTVDGRDTTVTCTSSPISFYKEPVHIHPGRFMRVDVALANATNGVCINDVPTVDIEIDGSSTRVFPDPGLAKFFRSTVTCGGDTCVVAFDLVHLEAIRGSKNEDGIYNTTCTATVKLGFGEACDDYLKQGGIDCSPQSQHDVFSTAEGQILFSLSGSTAMRSTSLFVWFLMAGVSFLTLIP